MVSDTAKDAEKIQPRVLGKPGAATSVAARRGHSKMPGLSLPPRAQVEILKSELPIILTIELTIALTLENSSIGASTASTQPEVEGQSGDEYERKKVVREVSRNSQKSAL